VITESDSAEIESQLGEPHRSLKAGIGRESIAQRKSPGRCRGFDV